MKRILLYMIITSLLFSSCRSSDANDQSSSGNTDTEILTAQLPAKTNSMKILAHFMIWFETNKT
ncbi:MAG TPA: hypothetical protein PLF38_02535, partial [Xylanibacter oryzae]|nr:hypothetical protein [Xylanibacter oryzae]